MVTEPRVLYEFGPFQIDPEKQILLRDNEPVAITPKAFETLLYFVRRSREDVSKDELMKAIWPDSFVEEANLTQNVFRLRKALGDLQGDQRYIVTLPGRGYRFAAQVRTIAVEDADHPDVVITARSRYQMVVEQAVAKPDGDNALVLPASVAASARVTRARYLWICAALALLIAVTAFSLWRSRRPVPLSATDSVVIADFANSTGDPVFDGTLRQGLAVQLEQSPFLSIVTPDRIQRMLQTMGQPPNTYLTAAVAREVCERNGSAAVLDGSIAPLGGRYVIGLRATQCRTGKVLVEEQVEAAKKEDVLHALDRIARPLRIRLGESLPTVEKYDIPLAEATTPSLEAFKAYDSGWRLLASAGSAAAIPEFKRATEIDPQFAMAYVMLGRTSGDIGQSDEATKDTLRAYQLRGRTNDAEKLFIRTAYETQVTGNLELAQQACEQWERAYPRAALPHAFLAGLIYPVLGRYERALDEGTRFVELDPDFAIAYNTRALAEIALGGLDDAEKTLQLATNRKLELADFLVDRYEIAFLKGDKATMDRLVAETEGKSESEDMISAQTAFALAYEGHLQQARAKLQHAADRARQSHQPERAALFMTAAAVQEAWYGEALSAKRDATAALTLSKGREVEYGSAFALALAGDSARAETLANDLEKRYPEDTAVKFSYVPTLRGLLALNRHEPPETIEQLQVAVPFEFGEPQSSYYGYFGTLYPVYVRGMANLAAHKGVEAAGEFKKILDHRGIVVSDPIGALAHLQLARALDLSGDKARAKNAYQDFLTLWKNADPNIPVMQQAKAEFSKLH
jgi:DNA-binding winged helix-turn-helix (wHTH) protein/tetratricopeptide (TPR) repeat protein